ncbi:MAG: glutamate-cysteine ligase family protein, partial [Coriobacteriales bacterium]
MDIDTYERNIKAIAGYIRGGETRGTSGYLGFEVEHFVVNAEDNGPVFYSYPNSERPGVEDILLTLSPKYDGEMTTTDKEGNVRVIGLEKDSAPVTIEPGAQLEVSIGPRASVRELEELYRGFRENVDPVLDSMGYKLMSCGYHPTACAREIPIIPKHRYAMMNEHFKRTGKHGICMMRASASTQVSIDYSSEQDCMDKMRLATVIGPLLYFLFDNSPIFEGELVGAACADPDKAVRVSRSGLPVPKRMARAAIWNDVDPARSMAAPFLFRDDDSYEGYARMLMARPPILTLENANDDTTAVPHGNLTGADVFDGKEMTEADIEHVLSMFFFDVRLKRYIEFRVPDSMPIKYALSFAALAKGIFYNTKALAELKTKLSGVRFGQISKAKADLMRDGYDAMVYGKPATEWLSEIFDCAAK